MTVAGFILELTAIVCAGLFAGAALYITLVEHPARMECGSALAVTEFGPSYRRATVMQASLAIVSGVAGLLAWWSTSHLYLLIGSGLILSVVPWTLIIILPVNRKLLDTGLQPDSAEAQQLLHSWGRLHAVRTLLSFLSLTMFLLALLPIYV